MDGYRTAALHILKFKLRLAHRYEVDEVGIELGDASTHIVRNIWQQILQALLQVRHLRCTISAIGRNEEYVS